MSPRSKKSKTGGKTSSQSRVSVQRNGSSREKSSSSENFIDRIQTDLEKNQSYLNLILGALIVIVLGVLIFNYFNKPAEEGEVTQNAQQTTDQEGDVAKDALPGTYTVKEGDTLFLIAQNYYDDGNMYSEIVTENNLSSDSIEVGQKLIIPRIASAQAEAEASPSASPSADTLAQASAEPSPSVEPSEETAASPAPQAQASTSPEWGKGGAENQTVWGQTITGDTYTVVRGDWLSTIAGRSYGDIMMYQKIAQANNITNPNVIEVGTVLKIPRD